MTRRFATVWLWFWLVVPAVAQTPSSGTWQTVRGQAADIAVGADGSVFAVDPNGRVWGRKPRERDWRRYPGRMRRIAVGPGGQPWAVDVDGALRRYEGRTWRLVGRGAADVAVAPDGAVYVTTNTNRLARYDIGDATWAALSGSGVRIAAGAGGALWAVGADGNIARRLDDAWVQVAGRAVDITIGSDGEVVVVGTDGELYAWRETALGWFRIAGSSGSQAVSLGGRTLWRSDTAGAIFVRGLAAARPRDERGGGSTSPGAVPDRGPVSFEPAKGQAVDLAIGLEGSVFALSQGGSIRRWSNADQRFNTFPGDLDRLATDPEGRPWGIGRGDLFRHDGAAWRRIALGLDNLRDLSIGSDGTVMVIDGSDRVFELGEPFTSFQRRPGQGRQIAVAPGGDSYWLIDSAQRIFACQSASGCTRQPLAANDIAIGPGGTVAIVDTSGALRRFDARAGAFELVRRADTARVALGPNDRPWIVDSTGKVFPSAFFERDESGDRNLAIATWRSANVTQGDGGGGIEIVQTLSFSSALVPESEGAFASTGQPLLDVTVGHEDYVIATSGASPCAAGSGRTWVFDATNRVFKLLTLTENASFPTAVAAGTRTIAPAQPAFTPQFDAIYATFALNCSAYRLLEYSSTVFVPANFATQNFDAAAIFDMFEGPLDLTTDLDVTADDFIAFVDRKGHLVWFEAGSSSGFVKLQPDSIVMTRVGAGKTVDTIWVVDTESNVYELQNQKDFVLRSHQGDDRALDVGVGHDNSVFIVDLEGTLKKWNPATESFDTFNKTGLTHVAVTASGKPVVGNFPASRRIFFAR